MPTYHLKGPCDQPTYPAGCSVAVGRRGGGETGARTWSRTEKSLTSPHLSLSAPPDNYRSDPIRTFIHVPALSTPTGNKNPEDMFQKAALIETLVQSMTSCRRRGADGRQVRFLRGARGARAACGGKNDENARCRMVQHMQ